MIVLGGASKDCARARGLLVFLGFIIDLDSFFTFLSFP
jgi:hypothetical protein